MVDIVADDKIVISDARRQVVSMEAVHDDDVMVMPASLMQHAECIRTSRVCQHTKSMAAVF